MSDALDKITAAWHETRPEVDVSPMQVLGRLNRLARILEQEYREFFGTHNLETGEFDVLATLRRSGEDGGLTAGALNKAAMVTSGAITNRIDRLAAKGLVERLPDPTDRRAIRVHLTPEGLALVDKILPLHVANGSRLLADLSPTDREQLAVLLRSLSESWGDTSLG